MRAQAHKVLRRVTRARKKDASGIDVLISAYKEIRSQLKKLVAKRELGPDSARS